MGWYVTAPLVNKVIGSNMAKPVNTVMITLDGKVLIMKTSEVPWECKGTSVYKANQIKQEIENV